MNLEDLDRLEAGAHRTRRLKAKHKALGHDWVVNAHTLTSEDLIKLVQLARRGLAAKETP